MVVLTLVSAYYIIKSKYEPQTYERWINNFMKIKTHKIIYTDENSIDTIKKYDVYNKNKTKYIIFPISDFLLSKYNNLWTKHHEMDIEKEKHSIELYKIWGEKLNFLKKAIKLNPFDSSHFVWCDIGAFRCVNKISKYLNWPKPTNLEKIIFLNLRSFEKTDKDEITTNNFKIQYRIGGGIIGGNIKSILQFHEKLYEMYDYCFNNDIFCGKDQNIYILTILKNPNLVKLIKIPKHYKGNSWFYLEDYLNK